MKCPRCQTVDLLIGERAGIEVDYCNTCRGIWLDAGEIDKIIERHQQLYGNLSPSQPQNQGGHPNQVPHSNQQHSQQDNSQPIKRESWWERITDILD